VFALCSTVLSAAVFLEDLIAVGGVGVAATGIGLSAVTGNSVYDAVGSITIGLLMGGVSLFLVQKNMQLLGGQRAQREAEAVRMLEADDAVLSVHDVKSTTLAPGSARFVRPGTHTFCGWLSCH
jgi:zinc transporter 9